MWAVFLVGDITYNFNVEKKGHEHQLVAYGMNKKATSIEGEKGSLTLLKEILGSHMGQSFDAAIDSIVFPEHIEQYNKARTKLRSDHRAIYLRIVKNQNKIDAIVYQLYDIQP